MIEDKTVGCIVWREEVIVIYTILLVYTESLTICGFDPDICRIELIVGHC